MPLGVQNTGEFILPNKTRLRHKFVSRHLRQKKFRCKFTYEVLKIQKKIMRRFYLFSLFCHCSIYIYTTSRLSHLSLKKSNSFKEKLFAWKDCCNSASLKLKVTKVLGLTFQKILWSSQVSDCPNVVLQWSWRMHVCITWSSKIY